MEQNDYHKYIRELGEDHNSGRNESAYYSMNSQNTFSPNIN